MSVSFVQSVLYTRDVATTQPPLVVSWLYIVVIFNIFFLTFTRAYVCKLTIVYIHTCRCLASDVSEYGFTRPIAAVQAAAAAQLPPKNLCRVNGKVPRFLCIFQQIPVLKIASGYYYCIRRPRVHGGKRKVSVWCLSVCLSVCLSRMSTSPHLPFVGGSRRIGGQTRLVYVSSLQYEGRHTCYYLVSSHI